MTEPRHRLALLAAAALLAVPLACTGQGPAGEEAAPGAAQRVESSALGLALASLPPGFSVVRSDGSGIELTGRTEKGEGRMTITVGAPQPTGVNLVAEVKAQKERALARPAGQFMGQVELGTPYGTAYSTRSRHQENGAEIEELVLFGLHPSGDNRLLTVTYVYRAGGDTELRRDQLLAVSGEIEALAGEAPGAAGTTTP